MEAASASRDVNICLVPEFTFDINGPKGLLEYVLKRLKIKKHIVIVAAEGAGNLNIAKSFKTKLRGCYER